MNNIQKLIGELKLDKQKRDDKASELGKDKRFHRMEIEQEASFVFDYCIQKLTLLLNAEAQTVRRLCAGYSAAWICTLLNLI